MSLVLNMSSTNDNQVIWVLKTHSEGANLITNGTFDSGSNWTANADWTIAGGKATYTYSAVASADLDQTISAVSAVPYILEYEISGLSGSGYTMSLMGGGTAIVAAAIDLPITEGFHRVNIFCVATKTLVRFHTATFGAGDSLSLDNVKLRKVDETAYLGTKDITLTNTYDGKVLEFGDRISDISEFMDVGVSGGIAGVSSYVITISRYVLNTKFDGFISEFYPDKDGGYLIAREIDIGIVWDNATNDNQITWLMRGRVTDYRYSPRRMVITILQSSEFDARLLPYYSVQKDYDNDVSYYTEAPEENYGMPIPIVYGDFEAAGAPENDVRRLHRLSPCIIVNAAKSQVLIASHKCDSLTTAQIYMYISSANSYMKVYTSGGSTTSENSVIRTSVTMQNASGTQLLGNMQLPLLQLSDYSTVTNIGNVIDRSYSDSYNEIDAGEIMALRLGGGPSTREIGALSTADADIAVKFGFGGDTASRTYRLNVRNQTTPSPVNDTGTTGSVGTGHSYLLHQFGAAKPVKHFTDVTSEVIFPWTIEELDQLEYYIENTGGVPGQKIRVYYGLLHITDIIINGISKPYSAHHSKGIDKIIEALKNIVEYYKDKYGW